MNVPGPAVALLELESIARGFLVADALVKRAAVRICLAEPVSPGKYVLLFSGDVAEVEEALAAGVEVAGASLLDQLYLTQAATPLVQGLEGKFEAASGSVGIVELHTVSAGLRSADTALKRADVGLVELKLAKGIGGKAYYVIAGDLHMVEAALAAACEGIDSALIVGTEIIQSPHPELKGVVL